MIPAAKEGHVLIDLDGTLAHFEGWKGPEHIGEPVPAMVARVKRLIAEGREIRIFTARASDPRCNVRVIEDWCQKHLGVDRINITNSKNFETVAIYDDRATGIVMNRGISTETLVAYSLVRVLGALGIKVSDGLEYAPAADRAVSTILSLVKNCDDALAHVDSANDALSYIKTDKLDHMDPTATALRQAQASLTKALAAMRKVTRQ